MVVRASSPSRLGRTGGGRNIAELCTPLHAPTPSRPWATLELSDREHMIADRVFFKEVRERMQFLLDVGLDYLSLGRSAGTLSGGEAQRIRLASQIGSGLVGVLYVLDEPSIGLHQRDNQRLIAHPGAAAQLGQHRHCGRARRGDHSHRRLRRRHRSREQGEHGGHLLRMPASANWAWRT